MPSLSPTEGGRGVSATRADTQADERLSAIRTFLIADVRGDTPFIKAYGDEAGGGVVGKFE